LLEYQKYKDAAEKLGGRPIEGRTVFGRGALVEAGEGAPRPFAEQSVWKLIEAFGRLLEKAGPAAVHDVVVDRISIGARINQLIDRLASGGGSLRFATLFDLTRPEVELRNQIVVTLLAILELARLKAVRVLQSPTDDTLFITLVSDAAMEVARHVTITSAVEGKRADEAAAGGASAEGEASATADGSNGESAEAASAESTEAASADAATTDAASAAAASSGAEHEEKHEET
jgi:hypothetical protein